MAEIDLVARMMSHLHKAIAAQEEISERDGIARRQGRTAAYELHKSADFLDLVSSRNNHREWVQTLSAASVALNCAYPQRYATGGLPGPQRSEEPSDTRTDRH